MNKRNNNINEPNEDMEKYGKDDLIEIKRYKGFGKICIRRKKLYTSTFSHNRNGFEP